FSFTANLASAARTANITLLGQAIAVTQPANFNLGTQMLTVGPGAGSSLVALDSSGSWTAAPSVSWLHPQSTSGSGSTSLPFSFDANTGATRTGTIDFNGGAVKLNVTQMGASYLAGNSFTTLVSSGL